MLASELTCVFLRWTGWGLCLLLFFFTFLKSSAHCVVMAGIQTACNAQLIASLDLGSNLSLKITLVYFCLAKLAGVNTDIKTKELLP